MSDSMVSLQYLNQLYDYNYWANHRLIATAETLSNEQLFRQHGHSWGSVQGVLVHMMSAEWVWLRRCQGESPRAMLNWDDYPTVGVLAERWAQIESEMLGFINTQSPESLSRAIAYTNTRGITFTLELWKMLVHVANHSTHHRGELASMFAMMDVPHPEDDWLFYFLERSGQQIK
jgi:uncharacterized damage-inducible protein DinB